MNFFFVYSIRFVHLISHLVCLFFFPPWSACWKRVSARHELKINRKVVFTPERLNTDTHTWSQNTAKTLPRERALDRVPHATERACYFMRDAGGKGKKERERKKTRRGKIMRGGAEKRGKTEKCVSLIIRQTFQSFVKLLRRVDLVIRLIEQQQVEQLQLTEWSRVIHSRVFAQAQVLKGQQATGIEGQQDLRTLHDVQAEGLDADDEPLFICAQREHHAVLVPSHHRHAETPQRTEQSFTNHSLFITIG